MCALAWEGFQRIGHGGASAPAPANTLASYDAAHAVGIDTVEVDVRERRGELALAHTTSHAARGGNVPLGDALAHLERGGTGRPGSPLGQRPPGVNKLVAIEPAPQAARAKVSAATTRPLV